MASQSDICGSDDIPTNHRPATKSDIGAGGRNRQLRSPLFAHKQIALPELPGEHSIPIGIVDAEGRKSVGLHSTSPGLKTDIGAVHVKPGQLFIKP
jgi:hypothetical protein